MIGRRDLVLPREAQELKRASKQLVRAAGGGEEAAATLAAVGDHRERVRQQRMSDCGLTNTPDFLRIDEVGDLEDVTAGTAGWPQVTRVLARRQGFVLVRIAHTRADAVTWHRAIGELSKETGETVQRICAALGDDEHVTREEVQDTEILEHIDMAMENLAALRELALSAPEGRR
jgi:hypothetical protein